MELHQLEYVRTVARHQSFTRAAEEISVSQSSLSQQINKLEGELGIRLFDRTTRKVRLTPAGTDFVRHINSVFLELDEAKRTVQKYLSIERGHITIGAFPTIGYYNLTALIADFQKAFPGVRLSFQEAECEELAGMLQDSKIDVSFQSEIDATNIDFFNLYVDDIALIVNSFHPIASQQTASLEDLRNEKIIVPEPSSGIYQNLMKACEDYGFTPDIIYHCCQIDTNIGLVRENIGVGILSTRVAMRHRDEISVLRIVPSITRRISLAVSKNSNPSPAVNVFIKFARQWASER